MSRESEARVARLQRLAKGQQQAALQMKLFPEWPDDRRGAPNTVIRSAIFGVVKRGKRKRVVDMPVAAPEGSTVTITGWRLDQHDLDVWLEVMHLARSQKPGELVRFTLHSMLKRLERSAEGETNYTRLKRRLKNLSETTIAYDTADREGVAGALIASFEIERSTGDAVVRTNPEIRALFESITWINVEQRRSLGANQLAKALHAALASHVAWVPMRLDTLMRRVGAEYGRIRDFKAALELVLDDFKRREWIRGYTIGRGSGGLVEINRVLTPVQARAAERLGLV